MPISTYTIGRENADILLEDSSVSRLHAELVVSSDGQFYLTDCGSKSGTFVQRDGGWQPVKQEFVAGNEQITLGRVQYSVSGLLALVSTKGSSDGIGNHGTSNTEDTNLPVGRVRRDPVTGDILSADDD